FRFEGHVTIAIEVRDATDEILLNAIELDVRRATVTGAAWTWGASIALNEATERCHLRLEAPLPPGAYALAIEFGGILNDKLRGFYRSVYKDGGETRYLAATQFEATDARRAFPCWDEPAFK